MPLCHGRGSAKGHSVSGKGDGIACGTARGFRCQIEILTRIKTPGRASGLLGATSIKLYLSFVFVSVSCKVCEENQSRLRLSLLAHEVLAGGLFHILQVGVECQHSGFTHPTNLTLPEMFVSHSFAVLRHRKGTAQRRAMC